MRQMVLQKNRPAARETRAQLRGQRGIPRCGDRAHQRDAINLFGLERGESQTGCDGFERQLSAAIAACQFGFLDGGGNTAVFEDCGGGIAEQAADSQDIGAKIAQRVSS